MATSVTVVEVDVPVCSLTYGVAPCTAAIPDTGDRKCFNTLATCQDRENFTRTLLTLRFFRPSAEPEIFDGLALLRDVSVTPQLLDPAGSIGQRESVRVTLDDFQSSDAGFDKYVEDRGYDTYARGTWWGKFRARVPSLRGCALRVMRGEANQPLSTFRTWNYVIETTAGPSGGAYSITAKDALKLTKGDRAQAPRPSLGQLAGDVAAGATSLTLTPTGIGNLNYPSSGKAAIGGREVVQFTRSGDTVTLVDRGMHNTEDQDHDEGARFQLVLEYVGKRPDEIIADLLLSYTDVDPAWVDQAAWQAEIEAFTPRLYGAVIAEPTGVDTLINELVDQVALVLWFDTQNNAMRLKGLRQVSPDAAEINADRFMAGSFSSKEQTEKRVSQALCYYGMRNPLEDATDPQNFACIAVGIDDTGADEEYGGEAIRSTFSRWISAFNRQAAERLNQVLLTRFRDPPRRIGVTLYGTDTPPQLGAGAFVRHFELQDDTGNEVQVPVQVISLGASEDEFDLTLDEQLGVAVDEIGTEKIVYIDADGYNLNLRAIYDSLYAAPGEYDTVTFIVGGSVKVGTQVNGNRFAISTGAWPETMAALPKLVITGRVMGRGGDGGAGYQGNTGASEGRAGEHALRVTSAFQVDNQGVIGGGGGGGGGGISRPGAANGGGGGGQGFENSMGGVAAGGNPSRAGAPGTPDAPGIGGGPGGVRGADGGALGQDGDDGGAGGDIDGGPAGIAVHGDDLITWINEGTIFGDRLDSTDPVP